VQPVDVPSLAASRAAPAWSDCDSVGDKDVQTYDPAEPQHAPGYWLSERGARCVLGAAETCDRLLLLEREIGAKLEQVIRDEAADLQRLAGAVLTPAGWLQDPRLWFAVGVVAGGAAVVLGGWAVAGVAR